MRRIRGFSGNPFIKTLLFGVWIVTGCSHNAGIVAPNILLILADDLGYGDLGCYNSNSLIPTPHLDQLAEEGIRLTNAYCPVAVCSPTRYALMTGRYPWRSEKKSGVMANYEASMIDSSITTLPEMLQGAGYVTAGFGKWHLGTSFPTLDGKVAAGYGQFHADDNSANLDLHRPVWDGPLDHGFDQWLGFSCASVCWILGDNTITGAIGHALYTIEAAPNKEHIEMIPLADYLPFITDHSLDFLENMAASESNRPFFLYFAPYVPHVPLAVSQAFQGNTEAGLYGDYVHELDHYIGKLLNKLESLGLNQNTIVFFASDNGSQFELSSNALDLSEAANSRVDYQVNPDSFPVHHPNWPLRGTKWTIYEGGVRTPFLARWPRQFPAGQSSGELFSLLDLMGTLASAIGLEGRPKSAIDSYDLLPVLFEDSGDRDEIVVQSSGRQFGLVRGKWKYITPRDDQLSVSDQIGELYDLTLDQSEQENLLEEYPNVVTEMKNRLEALIGREVAPIN